MTARYKSGNKENEYRHEIMGRGKRKRDADYVISKKNSRSYKKTKKIKK